MGRCLVIAVESADDYAYFSGVRILVVSPNMLHLLFMNWQLYMGYLAKSIHFLFTFSVPNCISDKIIVLCLPANCENTNGVSQ